MRKLQRPILSFWFLIGSYIMAHFLIVIVLHLNSITECLVWTMFLFLLLAKLSGLSCVTSDGLDRAFLTLLVSLMLFLFLFFPSFFRRLVGAFGTWQLFWTSGFRFFYFEVFHVAIWVASFGYSSMAWSKTSRTVLIHLLIGIVKPDWRFFLNFYNFFYQLIKTF